MIDFTCPNAIYLGKYNVISLEGIQSTLWGKHIYSFFSSSCICLCMCVSFEQSIFPELIEGLA
jgi:hypothetical protein